MQRRTFLQTASYLSLGAVLPVANQGCSKKQRLNEIGLALYTVRDAMFRDADEALRRVAEVGYTYVEGAKYADGLMYFQSPQSFKALLDKHGLTMHSGHFDLELMQSEPERAIAAARQSGLTYVVIPHLDEELRTKEGYQMLVDVLNNCGEICSNYGLQMLYHNHDFEFNRMVAGQRPFDFIVAETDPDLVQFELDLYWTTRAGVDYQKYFNESPGRFPLWHIKDMDDTNEKFFTSVGDGVIDWPTIFAQRELAGMKYFYVEQDQVRPGGDFFSEIVESYNYLRNMRF